MSKQLPASPNLEHLKTQAKTLLKTLRLSQPNARLHQAQFELAREYGFDSWAKLVDHLRTVALARESFDRVVRIFEHGIRQGRYAADTRRILTLHPRIAFATPTTALVALDREAIAQHEVAMRAMQPMGDLAALPIVSAAFSPFASERPDDYEAVLRELLGWGADPSSSWTGPDYPNDPLSVLYAASGVARNPAAVRLLLEAGANPDDNESVYHSAESRDPSCLKLLLEAGAKIDGTNGLYRMLDCEDPTGLALMLSYGPELNRPSALSHAIRRGRSEQILEMLVQAGGQPHLPDHFGVTPSQLAFERGISIPGASPFQPTAADELLAACWAGDVERASALRDHQSDVFGPRRKAFTDACWAKKAHTVDAFIAGGFTLLDREDSQGRPIHAAAFTGHVATVEALLKHHPDLHDRSNNYNAIPLQWAMYASEFNEHEEDGVEFLEVVDLLIAAGSPPPDSLFGSDSVRERLLEVWPDLK